MKKLLLSVALLAVAFGANAQAVVSATGYGDNFDDNSLEATAESGWYKDASVYTVSEAGGKLSVTTTAADQYFKGFGLYCKPTTPVNLTSNKTLSVVVNNTNAKAIKVRIDAKFVEPGFFDAGTMTGQTMINAGDTVNANYGIVNSAVIPANSSQTITIDYANAEYEYDPNGGGWTPETHTLSSTAFENFVGLYMVINGGAGETWCTDLDVCDPLTGTVTFDDLVIGIVTSTKDASLLSGSVKLYPNPATTEATLEMDLNNASNIKVSVTDVLGKEVLTIAEGNFSSLNKTFSTSNLNKGIYNVSYIVNGNIAKTELLMVK